MSGFDFTPDEEDQIERELGQIDDDIATMRSRASSQVASTVGELYRNHPYAPPGVVLAVGQAVASGAMDKTRANDLIVGATQQQAQEQQDDDKSWWERNVWDKVKTGSRWTMAGLNFVPQMVQGAAGQIFDENDDVAGWFISTDLGTLIANDEVAGDGWLIGGRAAELQAERARRYRGEINGQAFTIGRGLASTIAQPGSAQYSVLSGLVDAAIAIGVPSAPGAGLVKGAAKTASTKTAMRTLAGLTDAESAFIDVNRVSGWLRSTAGRQVVERIRDIDTVDEAIRIFPKVDDPRFWVEVVDKKTSEDALKYLEETLGVSGPKSVNDINLSRFDDVKAGMLNSWVARKSGVAKMFERVPGRHVVLGSWDPRDAAQSTRNINDYLRLAKVDEETRVGIVDKFARAVSRDAGSRTPAEMYDVLGSIQDAIRASMKASGIPDEAINDLTIGIRQFVDNKAVYGAGDDLGDPTNFGAKVILQDGSLVDAPLATAGLQSEMLRQINQVLPDPRRTRRMMSSVGWIYGKTGKLSDPAKYGELRMPLAALEAFQQEIWRPITLMTPGYVLRNMTDSAFRLTSRPDLQGGIFHPLQWIQISMYKKFSADVFGEGFEQAAPQLLRGGASEFQQAVGQGMREAIDPISATRRHVATKNWEFVRRSAGSKYRKGLQDEITLLHDDQVTRLLAQGSTTDDIIEEFTIIDPELGRIASSRGKEYLRDLQSRWSNRTFKDSTGKPVVGSIDLVRADGSINIDNLRYYIDGYAAKRLKDVTRDNDILRRAVAEGKFNAVDGTELSIFKHTKESQIRYRPEFEGMTRLGYEPEWDQAVQRLIDSGADLKESYKYRVTLEDVVEGSGRNPNLRRVIETWNKTTDYFFSSLYPKRSAYLMQSPAFRQFYYRQVGNLFDELNQRGVKDIVEALAKRAQKDGVDLFAKPGRKWLSDYVGDSDLADNILGKAADGGTGGRLSAQELDAYAKGFALDETKKLFYDASERSNFADILRVVAPFGSAWAEVTKSWAKIAMTNPETVKRVGLSVRGLRDADPDADGKGFFWKDPVTGEYVFNYPMSEKLGPLVSYFGGVAAIGGGALFGARGAAAGLAGGAGLGAIAQQAFPTPGVTLTAPARTLTMGLNFVPGVGPMVQVAASKLLGQLPQADTVRRFLAPYGEPEISVVTSWAQKFVDALGDPENNRLLADMTVETMQVLSATGKYNLADPADRELLENDAIGRARVLLMLRSLGQAVGPTRPTVEFKVPTGQGDVFASELAKAFRTMQTENYDTAVQRFLETFGDDAFLYVAGKSKATVGGLDASTKFGEFERNNTSLFARYKDVAGYFSPVGTNFDYQVYLRQLTTGQREKLKPSELVEEAQALVGKALYKTAVRQVGPTPTEDQRNALREVRNQIGNYFPGYLTQPVDINRLPAQIVQTQAAAFDPILDNNPVAEGARLYFTVRQQALDEAARRGFVSLGGKQVADLRGWLRSAADEIIAKYPEFQRLYDRVLFNEIDVDAGENR